MPRQAIVYADFACPFSYVVERAVLPRLVAASVRASWRGVQAWPRVPLGGLPYERVLGEEAWARSRKRAGALAEAWGVPITRWPTWLPNTRRALAMAEYAREQGRLPAFRAAVYEAHWQEGRDIEDGSVLRNLASAVGLHGERALHAARAPERLARVFAARAILEEHDQKVPGLCWNGRMQEADLYPDALASLLRPVAPPEAPRAEGP